MTITATTPETVAELLEELGGVPANRVIIKPTFGQATEADVLRWMGGPRRRFCEWIDGILVEKGLSLKKSVLGIRLAGFLDEVARPKNLGLVTTSSAPIQLWPGRVRIPDVAFISWVRIPGRKMPQEPIPELCPDLAVEVLSPSNTLKEMELKRQDYFSTGVRIVWEIDPEDRTVAVYTSLTDVVDLAATNTLTGDPVLPGFSLPLAELFAELDRQG